MENMERSDLTSFIPLQEDELIPFIFQDPDINLDHVLYPNNSQENDGKNNGSEKKMGGSLLENNQDQSSSEKKVMHREIERQRRKEMADLYASLRSVLPSKSIKGMRSASDQIHEATKYIRLMQKKVRQLGTKRNDLKKLREDENLGFLREKGSYSKTLPITVKVQRCSVGVEVLISCGFGEEGRSEVRLSKVLQLLLDEGLDVVDCNCTKFDGGLHYMIQSEVLSCSSMDLQKLREKLASSIENSA